MRVSPFARQLRELRQKHGLKQIALADQIGYEKSYISAVEIGTKGPPTADFIDRLALTLSLGEEERQQLHDAADASRRKWEIEDRNMPEDAYWLLKELGERISQLTPTQIRIIRDVLTFTND